MPESVGSGFRVIGQTVDGFWMLSALYWKSRAVHFFFLLFVGKSN